MINLEKLTTTRLLLRKPNENDTESVFEIHGDPETNKFNPAGPDNSIETSNKRLQKWIAHWENYGFGYWAVLKIDEPEKVIGFGGIMFKEIEGRKLLNLYFRFKPNFWGKGYANEMANKAIETGFQILNQNKIVATVRSNNLPSIKALEKLGMQLDHKIIDEKGESIFYILERPE